MELKRYTITSPHHDTVVTVTALTSKSAWSKFCAQRFGAMKPQRSDYQIKGKRFTV